jgi:MIP family channel proteins
MRCSSARRDADDPADRAVSFRRPARAIHGAAGLQGGTMNVRALVAEAIGTFVLVGFGSLAIVTLIAYQGLPPILTVPFGFGLALLAGIAMFGHVSGAHFNPAVTLAAWIDRRMNWMEAVGYVLAQIVGAVSASIMILLVFGSDAVAGTRTIPAVAAAGDPSGLAVSDLNAFILEMILTTVFIAVILTVTNKAPQVAVLVIPFTLVMIHFVAIPLTGSSVNPIRSLAPAIVSGNYQHLIVYLTAPFAGSILGWLIYRYIGLPENDISVDVEYDDDDLALDDEDAPAAT